MSEDETNPEQASTVSETKGEFSSDYFPTSAQPVFVKIGVLVFGVIVLCVMVYLTSTHEEEKPVPKKVSHGQELLEDEE